jgi:tRNA dimethylallyltransferase
MHGRLERIDPDSAAQVHPRDRIRIVRALEVHAQTGQPLGALRRAHALGQPRYRALTIALDLPRQDWIEVVSARARSMMEAGLLDEVRGLVERHGAALKPLRSVGYRQVVEGLAVGASEAEIERQIVTATRLYGKRQRTWFQSDPSVDLRVVGPGLSATAIDAIDRHLAPAR